MVRRPEGRIVRLVILPTKSPKLVTSGGGAAAANRPSSEPPRPMKHYTQLPSELSTRASDDQRFAEIRGGGFLTRPMLVEALAPWGPEATTAPSEILVDLRDVAGYETGCLRLAREWLRIAHTRGVRKIAFVASSTVLRTATRMAAEEAHVSLEFFHHERAAKQWLTGVATAPPSRSSPRARL